jgi:hypothetical protein
LLIDSVLIQARHLVNGLNITQAGSVDSVRYVHLGLNAHHVIKANGCWAESYFVIDDFNVQFDDQAGYLAYCKALKPEQKSYRPLRDGGEKVEAIRKAIAARASNLLIGFVDSMQITTRPGTKRHRLRIRGWAQNQADGQAESPVRLNIYAGPHKLSTVLANAYRADLRNLHGRHDTHTTGRHAFECETDIPAYITYQNISVRGENGQVLPLSQPLPAQKTAQAAEITIYLKPNRAA